jgi:hypothetical protein
LLPTPTPTPTPHASYGGGGGSSLLWPVRSPATARSSAASLRPRQSPPSPLSYLLSPLLRLPRPGEIQRADTHGGRWRSRCSRGTTGRRARSPEREHAAVERPLGGALRPEPKDDLHGGVVSSSGGSNAPSRAACSDIGVGGDGKVGPQIGPPPPFFAFRDLGFQVSNSNFFLY